MEKKRTSPEDIAKILSKIRSRYHAMSMIKGGQDWEKLFNRVDKDKNGTLELEEVRGLFRRVLKLPKDDVSDKQIGLLFEELDTDNTGVLSLDNIKALLECEDVMEFVMHIRADWDHTGTGGPKKTRTGPTPEDISEMRGVVRLFGNGGEYIAAEDAGRCLQALGMNPSFADLEQAFGHIPEDIGVDFMTMANVGFGMKTTVHQADDQETLIKAFKTFDPEGTGRLKLDDLYAIMMGMGEPLTPDEFDEFARSLDVDDMNMIDYVAAVKGRVFSSAMADAVATQPRRASQRDIELPGQGTPNSGALFGSGRLAPAAGMETPGSVGSKGTVIGPSWY